jgi:acyl-CoA dehydrogenase family member 9
VAVRDLTDRLKGISEEDRRQIRQAQEMLGPDPSRMGPIKCLFWGRIHEDALFPYPEVPEDERRRCDALLCELDEYLEHEHPATRIDVEQEIPDWVVSRLFDLGVMGMIVPREYGGGGFGITSYNRVLERIGRSCGSTAVMVSAHQSIGCGALIRFGTEEQKRRFLPGMARDTLSAFCLSEPNVGSDAAGQETRCERSADGTYYLLNGEKKWATSGALSGLFTVMARQRLRDPQTGEEKDGITALICTPDMEGIEVTSRNRSKCGIRGTWQARLRFTDVRVPRENLLHREGRGLQVALSCLNVGRCTLSAGMVGAARRAYEQALVWARHRYQFERPLADFEQIQAKLATMAAYVYAMEATLYMTTGMLDRGDEDVMLETAACKVFCSEMGYRTTDHAMQIMGGEGYMTENVIERLWRDSRINPIVEGANEVMHSFICAYGAKQLGEALLEIRARPWAHPFDTLRLVVELLGGVRPGATHLRRLQPSLAGLARDLERRIAEFGHQVKKALARYRERLVTHQMVQARLAMAAVWSHVALCSLSRLDRAVAEGRDAAALEVDVTIVKHVCALAVSEIDVVLRAISHNTDRTMRDAAAAALEWSEGLPNSGYAIPEKTPVAGARGSGRAIEEADIPQFGSGFVTRDAHAPARRRAAGR